MMENSMCQDLPGSRTLTMTLAFVVTVLATGGQAAEPTRVTASTAVQLALFNPAQVFDSERSVRGFRYSLLWGVNQDVSGLDISTVGSGTNGTVRGVQWALLLNLVEQDFRGYQGTLLVNRVGGDFSGFQSGFVNATMGDFGGLQLGWFGNESQGHMRGVQVGLCNVADDLKGLQLGLLNFNENGFLPFFPGFNFGF
jgi:hypothetical protein